MPRKKSGDGRLMNAQGQELRTVRLDLPADIHKRLRIEAAQREISMAQLARVFVKQGLAKTKNPKGGAK
jgi:plasmid stability protein